MPYPEFMIAPMREELTRLGIAETRTPEQVRAAIGEPGGTLLVVVNSVCGCAAGRARPGVAAALSSAEAPRPDRAITVFAGADMEATEEARRHFAPYRPSSPQVALFKDGKLVFMLERHQIEGRTAPEIAQELSGAFRAHCATPVGS